MSEVTIIGAQELAALRKLQRRWVLGWVAAALALGFGFWEAALLQAHVRVQEATAADTARNLGVAREQREVVQAVAKAMTHQEKLGSAILEMGEYLKERQAIVEENQARAPIPRPVRRP